MIGPSAADDAAAGSYGIAVNMYAWCAITVVGVAAALVGFMYSRRAIHEARGTGGPLGQGDRRRCVRPIDFGACLAGVALLGTWGSLQWAHEVVHRICRKTCPKPKSTRKFRWPPAQSSAHSWPRMMGGWIGRRITYALLCVGSFVSLIYMYRANDAFGAKVPDVGVRRRRHHGRLLRLVSALFPRAVSDEYSRHQPRIRLQFWPRALRNRLVANGGDHRLLLSKCCPTNESKSMHLPKPARRWPRSI